jgi:MFS family permease
VSVEHPGPPTEQAASSTIPRSVLGVLLAATLAVSTAYGVLLLLPLYIIQIGGDEADYGLVAAVAAVPAAISLGLLIRYSRRFKPHVLLAATSAVYALAALGVAAIDRFGPLIVVLGVVLGTAWAAAYTTAPMVISDLVDDQARAQAIGYVTGTIQVGFGLGPILGALLHSLGLSYPAVFVIGAALAGLAAALVAPLAIRVRRASRPVPAELAAADDEPLMITLWRIARSPALLPLIMVLLSACLFTTMNSFQTTFAESRDLSFDIFYGCYTVAVIAVRLGLSPFLADSASDRVVRLSTAGMVVAVVGFLFVGSNAILYGLFSVLLGITYGMALPALQARAVNLAAPAQRSKLLPLAGLLFEVAILVFPLVAGYVIRLGGYRVLFVVLLGFTLGVALLGLPPAKRPAEVVG